MSNEILSETSFQKDGELYRFLVENTSDGFFIAEVLSGKFLFLNRRICEIFGYPPEEAEYGSIWDVLAVEEHDIVKEKIKIAQYENKPFFRRSVYTMHRKDRSVFKAEISVSYTTFRGKTVIQGVLRDVTEQIYLQDQLRHAQKMEAIGILAGGIAHEFNNLMQAVSGYTELLLLGDIENSSRQKLEAIRKSTERAAELTRQILIFSQKVEKRLQIVKLNHEVMRIYKLLKKTFPKMIEIRLNLEQNLHDITADPALISQVIMNLSINARDAMSSDTGTLSISTANVILDEKYYRNHPELTPGIYVLLSVSDTGCGMSREIMRHLFEPFYTTKSKGKGTGLGLAMVYGIMKEHGGHIVCYSEPGMGTTFKIYLPVAPLPESEPPESVCEQPQKGVETVLLVDDEEFIRNSGRELLSSFGYTVLTAADGETALDIYRQKTEEIHLVILDLLMPGMGGKKCLKELLAINPKAKVLLASGYSPEGMTAESMEIGAKGFIGKPYPVHELLKLIRGMLDNQ